MTTSTIIVPPDYVPHARAERLIAAGRLVLASASTVAIYLEPSTPARYESGTYGLLIAYTAYAVIAAVYAWHAAVPPMRWRLSSHAADLVVFSLIVYLTEGPASPFFLYFVFSLFCATLRFNWRGVVATGVAAMAIYGAMALVASGSAPDVDSSRVLIRQAYLAVTAALLVYLGIYHQSLRRELASLAAWPRELAAGLDDVLELALMHAASVVRAERVLLLWEEREEPWQHVAVASQRGFFRERVAPGTFEMSAGDELRDTSIFVRSDSESIVVYDPSGGVVSEPSVRPLDPRLRERYGIDSAIIASIHSQELAVRFIVPNIRFVTIDDLALAHIAGRLVLATLEQHFFVQQVRQNASAAERLRISRELHDGIVQSLGGVGLQLEAIRTRFAHDPAAIARLQQVQKIVEHDQRELRAIVRELRPHELRSGRTILDDELRRITERFALEWGMEVSVDAKGSEIPTRVAHELSRIVNEALSNAARHGGATRAAVEITPSAGTIRIRVTDNGRGFPFSGRFDLDHLNRMATGPRTLKERAAALGGSLTIESSSTGAVIDVSIPAFFEEAS